ncbi:MAG: hypothetical protein L6R39_007118 [Caloplaca ligustica]|nr:MAG: hypothetical protein L6R39_007118 [Caloplaca ligustica]
MSLANTNATFRNPTHRQYVEAYSQQLLMDSDCEWGDLLSAAPRTLAFLGQAFVAATSNAANASVQIEKSGLLQHTSLRANLQHSADLGLEAFIEAEGKMKKLQLMAELVNSNGGSIDKILRLCQNKSLARSDLPRQIDRLKKLSSDCVEDTAILQRKFQEWADLTAAIRRACTSADDTAQIESLSLQDQKAKQETILGYQEEKLAAAKARLHQDRRNLDRHARDMAKAQDKVPSGTVPPYALLKKPSCKQAVAIRASDAVMNGISYAAQGAAAAFVAVTQIAAAGGPSINVRMTTNQPKTAPPQPAARKEKRNTYKKARANYESSQRAFLESQRRYRELEQRDRKEKDRFNEVQLELQKLAREDVSIEKVKRVLTQCIDNLTHFQGNVTLLRQFFNDIHNRISVIDQTHVADFLDSADRLATIEASDQKDVEEERRTYYLKEIQHDAFSLQASYAIVSELSSTYVLISKKHVLPGVREVNRLMLHTSQDQSIPTVEEKVKQINAFARRAQSEISSVATARRERIKRQLVDVERMITDAGETLDGYAEAGYGSEDEIAGDEWDDIGGGESEGTGKTDTADDEATSEE